MVLEKQLDTLINGWIKNREVTSQEEINERAFAMLDEISSVRHTLMSSNGNFIKLDDSYIMPALGEAVEALQNNAITKREARNIVYDLYNKTEEYLKKKEFDFHSERSRRVYMKRKLDEFELGFEEINNGTREKRLDKRLKRASDRFNAGLNKAFRDVNKYFKD